MIKSCYQFSISFTLSFTMALEDNSIFVLLPWKPHSCGPRVPKLNKVAVVMIYLLRDLIFTGLKFELCGYLPLFFTDKPYYFVLHMYVYTYTIHVC